MAQRVSKICLGCSAVFQGSDSSKTCSARCRKRLQRAKLRAEMELAAVKDSAEELAHKIEVRVEPAFATEGGYVNLSTKELEREKPEVQDSASRFDNNLHPWEKASEKNEDTLESPNPGSISSSAPGTFAPASPAIFTSPTPRNFAEEAEEEKAPVEQKASSDKTTIVHHHHHYAGGEWPKALAIVATVAIMAGALFFMVNRTNHQNLLNQQNQSHAIQQLAQTLGSSPIKSQPDATKIDFNVDTEISKGAKLTATGQVAIQNEANSTHAFTVQNSSGKSVLTTDTTNSRVGIGEDPTGDAALQVKGDITASGAIVSTGGNISLDNSGLKIGGTLVCTSNGCISSAKPAVVQPQTIDLADVAFLDHDQTLSGKNTFTGNNSFAGNNSFTGSNTFKAATFTGPFQVQSTGGSTLIATNDTKVGIGIAPDAGGATFQVGGDINVSGSYKVGNNAGSNLTCPAGDIIGSPVIVGGIIIGGTCTTNLAGAVPSFQQVYNASSNPHITLNSASGTLTVQDATTPLGFNLFVVQSNGGGTKYFAVNTNGAQVVGDVDITGQYKVNGSPLSSSVLADTSNLAKLNAAQTFSGANTFNNVSNSFTGDGSGLTNVNAAQLNGQASSYYTNASNLSSGNLNDARLSTNVALHNSNQTFTGANTFSNVSNSFTGSGSGLTSLNGSNISSGTVADARLSSNVALKDGNNTFSGANTFALSTGPLQIQDATTPLGTDLFEVTDSTGATKYFAVSATGATINGNDVCTTTGNCAGVGGDVTSSGGTANHLAKFSASNAIADSLILDDGTSVTIGGDLAANNITQNGYQVCDTSGNCVGGGGAGSSIGGSGTANTISMFTAAGTIGDSALSQSGTTVTANGNINTTGQYQVNGSQVSSSILSNDGNLAKLDGSQTFTGINVFNNASNSFTGDGSGLTALNGSNITSGTVGDAYLSTNVALHDANQTFTGANTFSNASNSYTGDGSNLTNLNGSNIASGTVADSRLSTNVALLNANQTASGNKTYTGTVALNNTGIAAFQIQNASGTGNLFVADTTDSKIGVGTTPSSSGATLQVAGNISSTTGFVANGNTGSSVTCTSGNVLQNTIITGGIITGGTCVANGSGVTVSLQQAYNASSPAVITLSSANGGVAIKDNAAPLGSDLFTVENNGAGTKYLNVTASGVTASNLTVANAATVTGTATFNGSVLAKNLSDSTTAFQIQNAAGTSTILNVDTSNKVISVNGAASYNTYSYSLGAGLSAPVNYPNTGGSSWSSIDSADLNGDGKPDIVTSNRNGTISVYMNNGDGTFAPRVDINTGNSNLYGGISLADFNGDGKPDIVAAASSGGSYIYFNQGSGTFGSPVTYSWTGFYNVATADLNGDGKPDIVFPQGKYVLNNGDGTFPTAVSTYPEASSYCDSYGIVATGDFNGDGKPDIVTGGYNGSTDGQIICVTMNNGNGTFSTSTSYQNGTNLYMPGALLTGDLNGDGKDDIVTANSSGNSVFVKLNNGDGTFAAGSNVTGSSASNGGYLADFNGDGKLDIVASRFISPNYYDQLYINNGSGSFSLSSSKQVNSQPYAFTAADFNGDGNPDIATFDQSELSVVINGATVTTTTHYGAISTNPTTSNMTGLIIQGGNGDDLLRLQDTSTNPLLKVTSAGVLQTNSIDTISTTALSIGSSNAGSISLNQATTVAANKTFTASGAALFADASNSTTAFQIQNATGANLLSADTTNMNLNVLEGNLILNSIVPANVVVSAGSNQGGTFSGVSGTAYYYKVTAIVNGQETTPSNEASFSSSSFSAIATPGAPTLALAAGSNLGVGVYQYKVTYVTANGETSGGTSASITTTSGNQAVNLTAIPTGPTGTTARKIYRTAVGGSTYQLLTTISDNTTTTYSDITADGSLGATIPGGNTAKTNTNNINLGWTAVAGASSYRVYRGTASGAETAYQTSTTSSFTDTGAAGTAGSVPTVSPFSRLAIGTSAPTASLDVRGTVLFKSATDSTTAFQVQNASGANLFNVDSVNSNISLGQLTSGALGAWKLNTNNLPPALGLQYATSVTVNGYVYVMGGCTNSCGPASSAVYYAKLNADGSTGVWQTNTNALPQTLVYPTSIAANGYVYVIGGCTVQATCSSNLVSTVYYSKINSDGSLGAWVTNSNAMPQAVAQSTSATKNGYAYVLGGLNSSGGIATVYYAKLNADGSTGAWNTNANSLPAARNLASSITANGYLYEIGGGTTVYYAKINSDGSTGVWQTNTNALPVSLTEAVSDTANGYIYEIGGISSSAIYYAKLNADGSTGAWQINANSMPQAYRGGTSVTSNGYIYTLGGELGPNTSSTIYYSSVQGITRNAGQESISDQLTVGNGLTVAGNTAFQPTADSTSAFSIQNSTGGSLLNVDSVNNAITILGNSSGQLGAWQTNTNALPAARGYHSSVTANGYVYLIGGDTGGSPCSSNTQVATIYYAKLNADGSAGSWTTSSNSLPVGICYQSSVTANGYVYVLGGRTAGNVYVSTVYYAKLNADGSTSAWQTNTNALPQAFGLAAAVTANGYVYVMGGYAGGASNLNTVYYAKLNADGSTGAWSTTTILPSNVGQEAAVTANGYMYVLGNNNAATVYYAKLNSNGTLGSWTTSSNPLPSSNYGQTAAVSNGYLYSIGGHAAGTTVYYAKLTADGSTGTWTTNSNSLPLTREAASTVMNNGYIYVLGGWNGSANQSTVYYASASRVQLGASLDLVGLQGGTLSDPGGQDTGSSGGSITAGNGVFVGSLQVQGAVSLAQGASIGGNLTANGSVLFQNSVDSAKAFQIQNASSVALFTVDSVAGQITFGNATSAGTAILIGSGSNQANLYATNGILTTDNAFKLGTLTSTQRNALTSPPTGTMIYNSTTGALEINSGTPASPAWISLTGPRFLGSYTEAQWASGTKPTGMSTGDVAYFNGSAGATRWQGLIQYEPNIDATYPWVPYTSTSWGVYNSPTGQWGPALYGPADLGGSIAWDMTGVFDFYGHYTNVNTNNTGQDSITYGLVPNANNTYTGAIGSCYMNNNGVDVPGGNNLDCPFETDNYTITSGTTLYQVGKSGPTANYGYGINGQWKTMPVKFQ